MVGIEPTLPFGNGFLRPARLPIPPRPHLQKPLNDFEKGKWCRSKRADYRQRPVDGQASLWRACMASVIVTAHNANLIAICPSTQKPERNAAMFTRQLSALCLAILLSANPIFIFSQAAAPARQAPGKTAQGTLLPNGWTLTPAGTQLGVSDLPMNMELSRDGRWLLVTTNGNGDQTLEIIDLTTQKSAQTIKVKKSWLGLAFAPDGKRFFVSGGDDNEVLIFDFTNGKATEAGKLNLGSEKIGRAHV